MLFPVFFYVLPFAQKIMGILCNIQKKQSSRKAQLLCLFA